MSLKHRRPRVQARRPSAEESALRCWPDEGVHASSSESPKRQQRHHETWNQTSRCVSGCLPAGGHRQRRRHPQRGPHQRGGRHDVRARADRAFGGQGGQHRPAVCRPCAAQRAAGDHRRTACRGAQPRQGPDRRGRGPSRQGPSAVRARGRQAQVRRNRPALADLQADGREDVRRGPGVSPERQRRRGGLPVRRLRESQQRGRRCDDGAGRVQGRKRPQHRPGSDRDLRKRPRHDAAAGGAVGRRGAGLRLLAEPLGHAPAGHRTRGCRRPGPAGGRGRPVHAHQPARG